MKTDFDGAIVRLNAIERRLRNKEISKKEVTKEVTPRPSNRT